MKGGTNDSRIERCSSAFINCCNDGPRGQGIDRTIQGSAEHEVHATRLGPKLNGEPARWRHEMRRDNGRCDANRFVAQLTKIHPRHKDCGITQHALPDKRAARVANAIWFTCRDCVSGISSGEGPIGACGPHRRLAAGIRG